MNSAAIIGGGITGLTAAFRLAQRGVRVTLHESGDRTGGVIRTLRERGYLAEFGPNSILETSPRIPTLIRDLGIEGRRIYSRPEAENRYLVRDKKPVAMPGSMGGFMRTPLFSAKAKLRLMGEPFITRSKGEVEESVGHFVKRRIGQEFLDYAINPLVAGVYAGDPHKLSVKHAFPKLLALEQKYGSLILGQILGARERKRRAEVSKQNAKKLSFDEGLQVLTDALREKLGPSVRLRSSAVQIQQTDRGWRVVSEQGAERDEGFHDAVLMAAPAHRLHSIRLDTRTGGNWGSLNEIHYPPVAAVVLGFRREDVAHPLDGFGMLIPEVEKFKILGTLFSSTLFPGRAPEGHVTLTSYVGGVRDPDLALLPPERLIDITVADLKVLLGVKGRPTFQHHCLFPKAIPQYEVGYGRFKELMDKIEKDAPGLFFAGHYRDGISLGDSIVSGDKIAERMLAFEGGSPLAVAA